MENENTQDLIQTNQTNQTNQTTNEKRQMIALIRKQTPIFTEEDFYPPEDPRCSHPIRPNIDELYHGEFEKYLHDFFDDYEEELFS